MSDHGQSLTPPSQKKAVRHKPQTISEAAFTNQILEWAKVYGFRRFHVRNSGAGGKSIVQGDKGFPDLVLVKGKRMIFAELKVGTGKRSEARVEQRDWLDAIVAAMPTAECYVWLPSAWSQILVVLTR